MAKACINVRVVPRLWECPAVRVPVPSGPASIRPDDLAGPPAPLPDVELAGLQPIIDPNDPRRNGWWNEDHCSDAGWINVFCPGAAPMNSVSVFMPACAFHATSKSVANAQAVAFYTSLALQQLGCPDVACVALAGSTIFEVLPPDQQCAGGYWFSEPVLNLLDSFIINQPQ